MGTLADAAKRNGELISPTKKSEFQLILRSYIALE